MKKIIILVGMVLAAFCAPAFADTVAHIAHYGFLDSVGYGLGGMSTLGFGIGATRLKKPPFSRRKVGAASGGVAIANGQISIELPKSLLVEEHIVSVFVSQVFATTAPTSSDVRRFFSKVELQSSNGTTVSLDGHQFYDFARFTEASSAPSVTYGVAGGAAAEARFSVDLHHIMDEAVCDLVSALRGGNELSSLTLVLTPAPDAANGFVGGVAPAAAAYTVTVEERALPKLSGKTQADRDMIGYGKAIHNQMSIGEIIGGAAVTNQSFKLKCLGKTRFVMLHTTSVTGGALADGIIDTISWSVPGHDFFVGAKAFDLKQDNIKKRGFNQTGVIVLDLGDDPEQWANLSGLGDILVTVTTLSTAPASWRVTAAQDYVIGLEHFNL